MSRGDDIHKDLDSIKRVYDAFLNSKEDLSKFPNIACYNGEAVSALSPTISASIHLTENCMLREVSDQVFNLVNAFKNKEAYPVSFTIYDDGDFEESDLKIMDHEPEADYYEEIYEKLHGKISDEICGKNEYNRMETFESRRFVYSGNSCISFIQLSIRDNIMDFHTVIRSSDVKNTLSYELKFLYFLAGTCFDRFKDKCNSARLSFNLNSAHILQ